MFIQTIDILGTIAFAISGVLVAMNKKMDAFGVLLLLLLLLLVAVLYEMF